MAVEVFCEKCARDDRVVSTGRPPGVVARFNFRTPGRLSTIRHREEWAAGSMADLHKLVFKGHRPRVKFTGERDRRKKP